MTDVTSDDFDQFDDKTKQEKREVLQRLREKLEGGEGAAQNIPLKGEVTLTVYDDDGDEKQVEKQKFELNDI